MTFDANGLVVPRFPEIVQTIEERQRTESPVKFKYQENKIIYQLNSVYAKSVDDLAQLVEAAFDSLKLSAAEGRNLEEIGLLRGVYKLLATNSFTNSQYAVMEEGATIPSGTLFRSSTVGEDAINEDLVSADPSSCAEALVRVVNVENSTLYQLTINSTVYSYTSDSDATDAEIQAGLAASIDADLTTTFTYTLDGTDGIQLIADTDTTMSVLLSTTDLAIENLKIIFTLTAVTPGAIAIPAETVDQIVGASPGVFETNNTEAFIQGRNEETESEFRKRIENGAESDCTGTVLNIQNALVSNVDGVTSAKVFENTDTSPTDANGRPIHSYEVLVIGGTDEDVAQEVWRTKPAGIELFGNTTESIVDSSGVTRFIDFSRPTKINIAVLVEYELYLEETFPSDGEALMAVAVVEYLTSLALGKDVIPSKICLPIYSSVTEGVGTVTVQVQTLANSGDPIVPANWQSTPISVADDEYAFTELVDVTITQV